jgi:hypothetical protein
VDAQSHGTMLVAKEDSYILVLWVKARTSAGLPKADEFVCFWQSGFYFKELLMTFKKSLESNQGQAVAEYILTLTVIAVGALIVFWSLNPDNNRMRGVFNQAVDRAIANIDNWN